MGGLESTEGNLQHEHFQMPKMPYQYYAGETDFLLIRCTLGQLLLGHTFPTFSKQNSYKGDCMTQWTRYLNKRSARIKANGVQHFHFTVYLAIHGCTWSFWFYWMLRGSVSSPVLHNSNWLSWFHYFLQKFLGTLKRLVHLHINQ